jgi:serine/threonine-protein kinase HSL1, negative regulator of Swe1 kinase
MSPSLALMNEIIKDRTMGVGSHLTIQIEPTTPRDKLSQRTPFGVSCVNGTLPLNVRPKHKTRPERPIIDVTFLDNDVEYDEEDYLIIDAVAGEEQENAAPSGFLTPRVSKLRKKRFHLDTPLSRRSSSVNTASPRSSNLLTPRSAFGSTHSRSHSLSPGPSSLLTPTSGPRASWFNNVFKFAKPSAYTLRSTHATQTTRNECRRLLMSMDVRVSIVDTDASNGSGLETLKCKLDNVKGVKPLKFRVDIRRSTTSQDDGDLFLVMVHEKGPMDMFRNVFRCLKDEWTLDVLGSKTPDQVAVGGSPGPGFGAPFRPFSRL